MSPAPVALMSSWLRFPRVSGDEPADARVLPSATPFSPRGRG